MGQTPEKATERRHLTELEDQTGDVLVRQQGRAGRITLNRPKALNALAYPMVAPIYQALLAWTTDPAVELVILDGAGDRGLCAGGDVISLYRSREIEGSALARRFWADEYRLNALIGRYPKPFVALQDGIVMGGGIGLSGHAGYRITTERSMLAMPETTIGLIPDVGGTWLLSRAPGQIGPYLGLMGYRMNAGDAIYAGFSDTCVDSGRLAELTRLLAETDEPISVAIASFAIPPPPAQLAVNRAIIDRTFGASTVEGIKAALAASGGEFAAATLAEFEPRSPLSMKLTLAAIRNATTLASLERALEVEYRLTVHLFEHGEFPEGVRALLIDKDRKPKWRPARLDEVTAETIEHMFAPLPDDGDIRLSTT
jgi:enoyl-CoA hydratase/carnithine racemase